MIVIVAQVFRPQCRPLRHVAEQVVAEQVVRQLAAAAHVSDLTLKLYILSAIRCLLPPDQAGVWGQGVVC